ncbi:MAG: transposase, partial [Elusimicrobiota bacterium]|nr:transposase [Elusimicrobiota bacterium]
HDLLRFQMFRYPNPLTTFIINFDSVVLTVYGHQEGSATGYSHKKRGRPSYHPLLAFESHLKITLLRELKPGNATDKSEALPFIKLALKKVPSTIARSRVRIRTDAGFYC